MITSYFEFIVLIVGLVATIPVYMGWFKGALSWHRRRKIDKLKKEKEFLSRLKSSDREFLGWLLHSLLLVVTVFCVALMFRGVEVDSSGTTLVASLHWILGGAAYYFAVSALGTYNRLRNFDNTVQKIDAQIKGMGG